MNPMKVGWHCYNYNIYIILIFLLPLVELVGGVGGRGGVTTVFDLSTACC